ncbi:Cytochrome P450 4c3 [Araneus ventricosus]|uniref:Cytochrome P450 4c3 n=1 Tax=Araneus ventricosus TaxID=182803 RepID=A0A4Y2EJC4_ARAVE|nr:Cytochrome P450 4c3 [Araneus ventricosus]
MLLVLVISIFIGILSVVLRFSLWRNKCSQLMPGRKPRFFDILGDTKEFIVYDTWPDKYLWQMNFFDVLRRRTEEYGKQQLFCLWITYMPFVMIVKAKAVKVQLSVYYSDASKWKLRRKLLTPCFHSDILRGFLPVFNEYSQKFVEFLQEETKKEFTCIETPVTLLTLDIICGKKKATIKVFAEIHIYFHYSSQIIQDKKKRYLSGQRDQDNRKRKALLDLLLDRHMEAGELSEEDIREEVDTFALAGHETVSAAIAWALYLIGLHSDVQTKLHKEMDKVFGDDKKQPASERDLSDLQYLDCVLKETNRLYPTAPLFGREIQEDTNICGHIIPNGTSCAIATYFLHRDEEVFPDPERFDPERFSPENCLKIPEYAYIPFSAGPRNCIGQRFAMMEIKVVISSILRNFSIESLDTRDKVKPLIFITLHPSPPIRIRIRPRGYQKQL